MGSKKYGLSLKDEPVPFGYKIAWLAIPNAGSEAIATALRLQSVRTATWADGIQQAYESKIFVTPAVSGWTLVVGQSLPSASVPEWLPMLLDLSEALGQVQYFGTQRISDYNAWAKIVSGQVVRAYARVGWTTLFDIGDMTAEEMELGLHFLDESASEKSAEEYQEQDELATPDEDSVIALASKWSIDPTDLHNQRSEGPGVLGELPQ